MQGPTHLMTGILIQKSLQKVRPLPLQYGAVTTLAVLSHGILDRLARATYHPPSPLVHDGFWLTSHIGIGVVTAYIVIRFWRDYKLSMLCSVLPDLDWIFRPLLKFFSVGSGGKSYLHSLLSRFIDVFIPHRIWNVLPNWNLERKGLFVELALIAVLLVGIRALGRRNASAVETSQPIPVSTTQETETHQEET